MLQITARSNFPTEGKPELHLWEPTLETLARQTFKDFELIVIDVFYDQRPDYFKEHNYGLRIKHIPAKPNPWYDLGLVQTCSQFNKGIIHADGELIFTDADSSMLPPNLMECLWKHYQEGWFVSLGFGADLTYAPELYERQLGQNGRYKFIPGAWQGAKIEEAQKSMVQTDWYKFLGYEGKVIMDHRYRQLFSNPMVTWALINPDWFYGISTFSLEATLKVNGYDTSFDGDSALNDVDMGWRLSQAGYKKLGMFRDSYIVEAYAKLGWHPKMKLPRPEIKCNYGIMMFNKWMYRYRVNEPLSEKDIEYIIKNICANKCPIRDKCRTLPHRGPFFNRNELELFEHWKKHGATINMNLEIEREMRKSGDAYQEGTLVNV